MYCFRLLPRGSGKQCIIPAMNVAKSAETPHQAVEVQLLTFGQMANAIRSSSYFYPKVHPSINAAAIATGQIERHKRLGKRGRPFDSRIDEACTRWDKGLREIADYADLLTQNTDDKMRKRNFRSLMSSINKRHRAKILAAEATNAAKPRPA